MTDKVHIAVFGCEPDEAEVFQRLSPETGTALKLIEKAPSEKSAE